MTTTEDTNNSSDAADAVDETLTYDPPDVNDTAVGDFFGADPFNVAVVDIVGSFGEGLFGLMVGVAAFTALYSVGGEDFATPSVVVILLGGILVPVLPGGYVEVALGVMFLGVAAAIFGVIERYVLDPGVAP